MRAVSSPSLTETPADLPSNASSSTYSAKPEPNGIAHHPQEIGDRNQHPSGELLCLKRRKKKCLTPDFLFFQHRPEAFCRNSKRHFSKTANLTCQQLSTVSSRAKRSIIGEFLASSAVLDYLNVFERNFSQLRAFGVAIEQGEAKDEIASTRQVQFG